MIDSPSLAKFAAFVQLKDFRGPSKKQGTVSTAKNAEIFNREIHEPHEKGTWHGGETLETSNTEWAGCSGLETRTPCGGHGLQPAGRVKGFRSMWRGRHFLMEA
jgi:hypothetical protein